LALAGEECFEAVFVHGFNLVQIQKIASESLKNLFPMGGKDGSLHP
jgi:hypothetical protein